MNVLVKMAFDGTGYHGFQVQAGLPTVCGTFQAALEKILGHKTEVKGCSRTDRGVHAKRYYISFKTHREDINIPKLPLALNANLPPDIRALAAREVALDFHARYSATGKEYTYYILNSHIDSPFDRAYHWRVAGALDENAMAKGAEYFTGSHDFTSFMAAGSKITDCNRTVFSSSVTKEGDLIKFKVSADGYLYNMVRIMTGTLVDVGRGVIKPEQVADIIEAKDRHRRGATAPAAGLFLTKVFYDFDF